jgi:hypothetical protein
MQGIQATLSAYEAEQLVQRLEPIPIIDIGTKK